MNKKTTKLMATALTATMGAGMATQLVQAAEVTPVQAATQAVEAMEKNPTGANIDKAYNAVKALKAGADKDALYKRVEAVAAPHHKAVYDIMVVARVNKDLKTIGEARKAVAGMAKIFINDAYTWSSELDNFTIEYQKTVVDTLNAIAEGKEEVKQATINELREIIVGLELQRSNEGLLKLVLDYSATLDKVQTDYINEVVILVGKATTKAQIAVAKEKYNDLMTMKDEALKTALKADLGVKLASKELELADAQVKSVEALNGKELLITFNKALDKADAELTDKYLLNGTQIAGIPVLSNDGKSVIITTSNVIDCKDAALVVEPIKTAADTNKTTVRYAGLLTYSDTVAPQVAKVEAVGGEAVITFAEALNGVPGVSVNGVDYSNISVSGKTLTIKGLEDGKNYSVEIAGAKDFAGNVANPINLNFTVAKPDAATPQAVTTTVKDNKVTLVFANALSDSNKASVKFVATNTIVELDGTDKAGVVFSKDKKTAVLDAQALGVLNGVTFINTGIEISGAGLTNTVKVNTTLKSDKTAAKLVSVKTTAAGKLLLTFDEDVVPAAATIDLKVTAKDGIYQSTPIAWDGLAVAYAKDNDGKDIKNTLSVDVDGVTTVGVDYTVEVPAGIKDVYDNLSTKLTVSVVKPATDNTVKPSEVITVSPVVKSNIIKLTFANTKDDKGVTAEALNIANYTLGGKALPSGTIIRYVDDKNNVEIILPEGSIRTSGDYIFTMKNIKDAVNNTLVVGQETQVIKLVENSAPIATGITINSSAEAVITFSENIKHKDIDGGTANIDGVIVKVNGKVVTTTITPADIVNNTLKIAGLDLKTSDNISVEFKNAEIFDVSAAENQIKDSIFTK